ncbi:hypothetical protein DFH07DRAFT_744124 [Mycena maculata]|uniref:Tyr recombinase domain-containing protein n=1 Tax=Mycena maculata TaxID=230809 RepID=A0AAD7NAR1_9AGAR|nr:hypothetical protein DFH07DRAFT_744124 [Mycena maculata]
MLPVPSQLPKSFPRSGAPTNGITSPITTPGQRNSYSRIGPKLKSSSSRPKPYPSRLALVPSTLRPLCFAGERLYKWRPLQSRSSRHATSSVAEADLQHVTDILSHAYADGTLETYGSGLLAFHCFCDSRGVPEAHRAPASPDLLSAFLAALAGNYAGKTLDGYLAGVRAWHIIHGVTWAPNKSECDALVRAAITLQPQTATKKRRLPYTVDIITILLSHLDPDIPLDASVGSCLTTGYYSCARLGELTVKTLSSFDPSKHVKRSDVREETDANGLVMTVLGLPVTKSKQTGEDIFYSAQNDSTDPRRSFANHLRINAPPLDSHLFSYKHKGVHRPLTKTAFITRIHKAFKAAKLDPLQGHGIRIGATLFYLLRGTPFDVVKTIGRWASDAFLLYLRKHAQIMAYHGAVHASESSAALGISPYFHAACPL